MAVSRQVDRFSAGREQLGAGEEEAELDGGVLRRVAAVNGVALDGSAIELADRAVLGLRHIGGTHHLAELGDGLLALQGDRNHRTAGHELPQTAVERPLLVYLIEGLGLRVREMEDPEAADDEAFLFEM